MTISKIATHAGVSLSTVSRVLNGRKGISRKTTDTVIKAMEDLGYNAYESPRQLYQQGVLNRRARGQTDTIGILWFRSTMRYECTVFIQMIEGISCALIEHGYNALVAHITDAEHLPPILIQKKLAGAIGIYEEPSTVVQNYLKDIPVIWVSSSSSFSGERIIGGNREIGELAATYLLERGHREIAFLTLYPNHPAFRVRGEGFNYKAFKAGVHPHMITPTASEHQKGLATLEEMESMARPLVEQLTKLENLPTGLFIPQDRLTAKVYRLLDDFGIRPGHDITIISSDNEEPYLAGLKPRPATIDIGSNVVGRHAVEQLIFRMRYPDESRKIKLVIEPLLIEAENEPCRPCRILKSG